MVIPNKKEVVILATAVVVTLGLIAGSVYLQQTNQHSRDAAVKTAQSQRASAIKQVEQVTAASKLNAQSASNNLTNEHNKLVSACATLTKAKLKNPVCLVPIE